MCMEKFHRVTVSYWRAFTFFSHKNQVPAKWQQLSLTFIFKLTVFKVLNI